MALTRDQIAWRAAQDLEDGWYVNLGIGLPLKVSNFLPAGRVIWFHSENGILGVGPLAAAGAEDLDLVNAGKEYVTLVPGGCFFSQDESFAMVRGGHLDAALIGAFEVSSYGDLANWKVPQRRLGNVGGAMDLAVGAKRIFVLMEHTDPKTGSRKLVERCGYPLTAPGCVSRVYTDLGVFQAAKGGFKALELAPGVRFEEVAERTGAPLRLAADWRQMDLSGFPG